MDQQDDTIMSPANDELSGQQLFWSRMGLPLPKNPQQIQWLVERAKLPRSQRQQFGKCPPPDNFRLAMHVQMQDAPGFTILTVILATSALLHFVFVRLPGMF